MSTGRTKRRTIAGGVVALVGAVASAGAVYFVLSREAPIDRWSFEPPSGTTARLPDPERLRKTDARRAAVIAWALEDGSKGRRALWVASLIGHPDPWERETAASAPPLRRIVSPGAAATDGNGAGDNAAEETERFVPHPAALPVLLEARERERDGRVRELLLAGITAATAAPDIPAQTVATVFDELLATPESDGGGVSRVWAEAVAAVAARVPEHARQRFDVAWDAIWPARNGPLQSHELSLLETLAGSPADFERLVIALVDLIKRTPNPADALTIAARLAPLVAKAENPTLAVATLIDLAGPGRPPRYARQAAALALEAIGTCTHVRCRTALELSGADLKDMVEPKADAYERVPRRVAEAMGAGTQPWNERALMAEDGVERRVSRYFVELADGRRVDVLKPLADRIACRLNQCHLTYSGKDKRLGYYLFVAHVPGGGAQRFIVDSMGGDTIAVEPAETIAQAHFRRWRDIDRVGRTPFAVRDAYRLSITLADGRVARFDDDARCGERCTSFRLTAYDPDMEQYEIAFLSTIQAQRLTLDRVTGLLTCRRQGREEAVTCPPRALSGLPQALEQ